MNVARQQSGPDKTPLDSALTAFGPLFFNDMVLAWDNYFCPGSRTREQKDGNPLREVRVLCNSIMQNNNIVCADRTMKFDPAKSVLHHQGGDEIKLNDEGCLLSYGAFFAENERRYS